MNFEKISKLFVTMLLLFLLIYFLVEKRDFVHSIVLTVACSLFFIVLTIVSMRLNKLKKKSKKDIDE